MADIDVKEDDKGPTVLKSEILAAIKEMKEGKAVGVMKFQQKCGKGWETKL